LIAKAIETLEALLMLPDSSKDTRGAGNSPFGSVIEGLKGQDNSRKHLFGSTINILKNQNKEK